MIMGLAWPGPGQQSGSELMETLAAHGVGLAWMLFGLAGAVLACKHAYAKAVNKPQRRLYRFVFKLGAAMVLLLIVDAAAVTEGLLPRTAFWAGIGLWFLIAIPGLRWVFRRLSELGEPDPYVLMVDGRHGRSAFVDAQGVH